MTAIVIDSSYALACMLPDERRPDVKADEIYGDTKIPERSRKK